VSAHLVCTPPVPHRALLERTMTIADDHLKESQVQDVERLIVESGLPRADFAWTLLDGTWSGYFDSQVPAVVHTTKGFFCQFCYHPPTDGFRGLERPNRGGYLVFVRPGRDRPEYLSKLIQWPDATGVVARWLGDVRVELGMPLNPRAGPVIPADASNATSEGPKARLASGASLEGKRVFIIHGHDDGNVLRLQTLLKERFRLDPVLMRERPGRGRTLIEKFESEAEGCAFAFALLTPDDQVRAATGDYVQARPNVAFEVGWFYGRLRRQNVCLLVKHGTKMHSDLDGVSRIDFSTSVDEVIGKIEVELNAAGLTGEG